MQTNGTGDDRENTLPDSYFRVTASEWLTLLRRLTEAKKSESKLLPTGITNIERERRLAEIQRCVDLRLSIEQIQVYLRTRGIRMEQRQIARYIDQCDRPRSYKLYGIEQALHTKAVCCVITRCAVDAWRAGLTSFDEVREEVPVEGSRKDLFNRIGKKAVVRWEVQRTQLRKTEWVKKMKDDLRTYKVRGRFTAAYVIQQGMIGTIAGYARTVLEDNPELDLFRFISWDDYCTETLNTVTEGVWTSCLHNGKHSLIPAYTV